MEVSDSQIILSIVFLFILVIMVLAFMIVLFIIQFKKKVQTLYANYYNALIEAENNERLSLSMALHDEVNPLVNGLFYKIRAKYASDAIEHELLNDLSHLSDNIRQVSHQMRRGHLSTLQMVKQINWFYKALYFDQFKFDLKVPNPLPEWASFHNEAVLAMFKELMSNSAKYANAQQVHLSITCDDSNLIVMYSDDGVGFDHTALMMRGIGIQNIKLRVSQLQGVCVIDGLSGFQFKAEWPLKCHE